MKIYFQIDGTLVDKAQQSVQGLRVEVFGKKDTLDELINIAVTDSEGKFSTEFSTNKDITRPYGSYSDLFFNVYSGNRQFKDVTTKKVSDSGPPETSGIQQVSFEIEVDAAGEFIVKAALIGIPRQTFGDGTSQQQRQLPALNPQYVAVEERSMEDILDIIRNYAEKLPYYDSENKNVGSWEKLFPDIAESDIVAFIQDPQSLQTAPTKYTALSQPHRVLLFTFLQLLEYTKKDINTITKRHLDFFYQEALQMTKRVPIPQEVHVLFTLRRGVEQQLIQAGTLLQAGKDSQGKTLLYKTSTDLVVNQAQIAQIKTIFNSNDKIYAAPDATQVAMERTTDQALRPWETFGGKSQQPSRIGFAITSPALHLAEGTRTITLVLYLLSGTDGTLTETQAELLKPANGVLQFWLSSAQGWIAPDAVSVTFTTQAGVNVVQYAMTLSPQSASIEPLQEGEGNTTDPQSPFPTLKLTLKEDPIDYAPQGYSALKELRLQRASLHVTAKGIRNFKLSNDTGELDSQKPFEPFGPTPKEGNSFQISHPEIAAKKLDSLDLQIQWLGIPGQSFEEHYQNYFTILGQKETVENNESFKWQSRFFDRGSFAKSSIESKFFDSKDATKSHKVSLDDLLTKLQGSNEYERLPRVDEEAATARYFEFSLLPPDFMHDVYPTLFAKQANGPEDNKALTILPPYTPSIQSLTLDYSASVEIEVANYAQEPRKLDQLLHLHPFGYVQYLPSTAQQASDGTPWLPQYNHEGALYIGVKDLKPRQNIAILFQMADGSANPDIPMPTPQWSYLSNNQWIPFEAADILSDTTQDPSAPTPNSLAQTGIITLSLPQEASTQHTLLPTSLHWIRAAVTSHSDGISQTVALHAQAILATSYKDPSAPERYSTALLPNSITKPNKPIPAIKSISQPYAAFGGRLPEQDIAFYTRISERLRHKNRAINLWDYERMVLEQFPEVYKVKCLTADTALPTGAGELPQAIAPGEVIVVVVPDVKTRQSFNALEPKVSQATIYKIHDYLQQHASKFVSFQIKNPVYEKVQIRCAVRFRAGYDKAYYEKILQQDLKKYLAPWAYDQGADISLGSKLYASSLIYFLEKQPYIDFVANMKLFHSEDGQEFVYTDTTPREENAVYASRPDAVLVTADSHTIDIIPSKEYSEQYYDGIGFMIMGLDNQVM